MPPAYEILLLNTAIPQIQAAQSGDTYLVPRDIAFSAALTLSAGTANGVPYLNASKVLTTGSALTFDGTNLKVGNATFAPNTNLAGNLLQLKSASGFAYLTMGNGDGANNTGYIGSASGLLTFGSVTDAGVTTEGMRLTSTGLGIGTTSPLARLSVQLPATSPAGYSAAANSGITLDCGTSTNGVINLVGGGDLGIFHSNSSNAYDVGIGFGNNANRHLTFSTANAERMRLDSSGNLGLGVTPSGWKSTWKSMDIGTAASFYSQDNNTTGIGSNLYFSGTNWYRRNAGYAALYQLSDGAHVWYTAASSTAGSTFTPSQAMTLDASGNLVVGATSTSYRMEVVAPSGDNVTALFRSGDATAANNAGGGFRSISSATAGDRRAQLWLDADGANLSGGDYFYIQKNGNSGEVNLVQQSNAAMLFSTNGTERARITSGGVFVIKSDGSNASNLANKRTTSVGTGATTISLVATSYGQLVMVTGIDGGNIFSDLIFTSITAGPTVISAKSVSGTPASRTYTMSGDDLQLAMGSGSYDVRCTQFTNL